MPDKFTPRRLATLCLWFAFFLFVSGGFTLWSALVALLSGILAWLAALNETRAQRPRRSYYRWALLSLVLACVLIGGVAGSSGSVLLGGITWAVMSGLGLFWTIHYERTEPLV